MGIMNTFFKWFGPKKAVEDEPQNQAEHTPDSPDYGAGHIIHTVRVEDVHSILKICQQDFSEPGYKAANHVPDNHYAQTILRAIKGKLLLNVEIVRNQYMKRIRELEQRRTDLEREGFRDLAGEVERELDKLKSELDKLNEVAREIEEETQNGAFTHIRETFMTGFRRGYVEHMLMNRIQENL
ncbi:MAG: hypothetical protein GXO27_04570 [Chlorobi bacterium]|nr:hypothetical protein [Chlorobiota bacterium]